MANTIFQYKQPISGWPGQWIALDLDGTISTYTTNSVLMDSYMIGDPILPMVELMKYWHGNNNIQLAIFTARLSDSYPAEYTSAFKHKLGIWCQKVLGFIPYLTGQKHRAFKWIIDDRAIRCPRNSGAPEWPTDFGNPPLPGIKEIVFNDEVQALKSIPEILEEGAKLFQERNKGYNSAYHDFGGMMKALYPDGITLKTPEDFSRYGVLTQVVSKLMRYTNSQRVNMADDKGTNGHPDSAQDLMVYAAMLRELTHG